MSHLPANIVGLWLGLLASPGLAATAASDGASQSASESTTTAATVADDGAAVERLYLDAQRLYEEGDLPGALHAQEECYATTRAANLLFNIAQLHRELDQCRAAIEYYERYVAEAPEGERVDDARKHLDLLRPSCASSTAPAEPTIPVQVRAPAPPQPAQSTISAVRTPAGTNYWPIVGWSFIGVGAFATFAAIYSATEASQAKRDVERMRDSPEPFELGDFVARNDDFFRKRNWAFGFGAAAVATTGLGVCALTLLAPKRPAESAGLSIRISPAAALLGYGGRF